MTESEARALLKLMTSASTEPKLTDDEINLILSTAKLSDTEGRAPSDAEWEPTWDLNRAAARGWDIKAGRASDHHAVTINGRVFSAQQVYEHCEEQARKYRKRIAGTIAVENCSSVRG